MIGWICCALALVFCAVVLVWRWRRERALLNRLDDMLDAAVEGRFHASDFDESQLSAFESRLAQYLQAGADSSLRLAEQRDQIAEAIVVGVKRLYLTEEDDQPLTGTYSFVELLEAEKDA